MTVGTPGFIGERLREGREARAMSQAALADFLGVTRQAVSAYESGAMTPAPSVARHIASVLRVPPEFFRRADALGSEFASTGPTFFRALKNTPVTLQVRALRRQDWVVSLFSYLLQFVDFPEPTLPMFDVSPEPTDLSDDWIEAIVQDVRQQWHLGEGPIGNVVWLLESHGVVVVRDEIGAREVDAFSAWRDGVPFMTLGSDKGSAVRSRFDAAHELGHLLMHHRVDAGQVRKREDHKLLEGQANRFASAFLLPKSGYKRSMFLPNLEEFLELKPKWGVSIQSQAMRCLQLSMISNSTHSRLFTEINKRGWRQREPLDNEIPSEQPVLLRQALEVAIEEGQVSPTTLEHDVSISLADIEALAGLPTHSLLQANTTSSPDRGVIVPFSGRLSS